MREAEASLNSLALRNARTFKFLSLRAQRIWAVFFVSRETIILESLYFVNLIRYNIQSEASCARRSFIWSFFNGSHCHPPDITGAYGTAKRFTSL